MSKSIGWAATDTSGEFGPYAFERREPRANDVVIDIDFCGICHSDIHTARGDWGPVDYPLVTGHEIVGRVREIGDNVTRFSVGEAVGVGCMVDSCLECEECTQGLEQYCRNQCTWTYGSIGADGELTQGGYSNHIVVREEFVVRMPDNLDPAAAAPLLLSGITTYSPLRHWNVTENSRVGVAGFGGLGHMGVKLAKAMGAHVTVLTSSDSKTEQARKAGADEVVIMSDEQAVRQADRSLDVIISTIPKTHDVTPYLGLLKLDGTYVIVGAIEPMKEPYHTGALLGRRASISGSGIGGIKETEEMLQFCADHSVVSDVEKISVDQINEIHDRLASGDASYRYVIDMATLREG